MMSFISKYTKTGSLYYTDTGLPFAFLLIYLWHKCDTLHIFILKIVGLKLINTNPSILVM